MKILECLSNQVKLIEAIADYIQPKKSCAIPISLGKPHTYLARTNCWLGLFVPGPVGLHLIVYISWNTISQTSINPLKLNCMNLIEIPQMKPWKDTELKNTLECSLKSWTYFSCFMLHIYTMISHKHQVQYISQYWDQIKKLHISRCLLKMHSQRRNKTNKSSHITLEFWRGAWEIEL